MRDTLLDTDTLSEIMGDKDAVLVARAKQYYRVFDILPIESEEAGTAGRIVGLLKARGLTIGHMDPFIAATAIENGLVLATSNTNHYQRIVDLGFQLEFENWRDPLR